MVLLFVVCCCRLMRTRETLHHDVYAYPNARQANGSLRAHARRHDAEEFMANECCLLLELLDAPLLDDYGIAVRQLGPA
jgi:hypothetical protein